jgi:hypothetical protein
VDGVGAYGKPHTASEGDPRMSEYQYYEFQAIDRPLDPAAQQALRSISSRARFTATRF